jgi:transposase
MVLACAERLCNVQAGARLDVHAKTVAVRARFLRQLEGMVHAPRPGAPRTISDEQVEQVITNTPEETLPMPPVGRRGRWPRPPA